MIDGPSIIRREYRAGVFRALLVELGGREINRQDTHVDV